MCESVKVAQLCPTLRPHGLQPARLLCPWGFSTQESWSGLPCPPPGNLPNPRIEPRSPTLQADSLPSAPPGKFKNTGVGSLSLLQGIFLTRESDRVLLHCRRILYQLSYQGSPEDCATGKIFSPWALAVSYKAMGRGAGWRSAVDSVDTHQSPERK